MKKKLLFLVLTFYCLQIQAQHTDLWQKVTGSTVSDKNASDKTSGKFYYNLDVDLLKKKLSSVTAKKSGSGSYEITIPDLDGAFEKFTVWESSNFEPELQAKYPDIKSYQGRGVDDKTAKIHFSFAPIGMQVMVSREDKPNEYVEVHAKSKNEYVLFSAENNDSSDGITCETLDADTNIDNLVTTAKGSVDTGVFKKFRLALSCTGEYAQYFGGTKEGALAGMNATLTRVNAILNKDLSMELVLIANTDAVIYTDPMTDPYSDATSWRIRRVWVNEVQQTMTAEIGEANYDIGHLFGLSGGGGLATVGAVCNSPAPGGSFGKAAACSSTAGKRAPKGDSFDLMVTHEIGHQLGASHAYSYQINGTSTSNEPASGSTIMSYAGVTRKYDLQEEPDDYFSHASILQIQNKLAGKTCSQNINLTDAPPLVDAGTDYTIPINTPFVLKGTGSSSAGSQLTYTWEQNDPAITTDADDSFAYPAKPDGPLFRSVYPGVSPVRYMPALRAVLQNKLSTNWESVSSVSRTLHFSITARNNAALGMAQTSADEMIVNVSAEAGPFVVTSQNRDDINWEKGSSQLVTWDVNNTDKLQGSSAVNIKLSIDGGLTYPIILASNTPNDGSRLIVTPTNIPTSLKCRILVEPSGNIYYAVNSRSFSIGYKAPVICNSYTFDSFTIPINNRFTERTVAVPPLKGKIENISVAVSLKHQRSSDLEIEIVSPQGTKVKLFQENCDAKNDILELVFDDFGIDLDCYDSTRQVVLPVDVLEIFKAENPEGVWTFRIVDRYLGYSGRVNTASLVICTSEIPIEETKPELENTAFAVYPNPNKGSFTVELYTQSLHGVKVYVHDAFGKNVYADTFESSFYFSQKINLPGLSAGVYLVTVIDGSQKMVKKIVVY
ncbi:zinc-dependent metalloprotease [Flavobacterium hercynium]|uniref:Propanediol utilization protein n=1 Tax=Flavobacterium hercynium TaxID=387094 RepID=A0A226HMN0_9FLAO|nr:zinc-dependent metalloprotease family protein [Flavobacterium hercynium]OXA94886.1 propanediol utilization protein [Flavobacterium hercynium]SMP09052.1 Por secretion system C-terminal sorting domain-containing protein [Flavobacterium hercynium]